jgi:drug/metabolite transporter (DMT)-like permease
MTLAVAAEKKHAAFGVAILSLTTFLWGTTFVVTKNTLVNFPASELILLRFLVAGVVFLPFLRGGRKLWLAAIELGVLLWAGFATQTIGLRYTTCDRSAFLTCLHVVFVPALAGLMGRSTRLVVWVAAVVALLGVGLLSHDGSPPNRGDAWTIACALVWAIYIARLETLTVKLPSRSLTAAHLWVVVVLSAGWTLADHPACGPIPWLAIIYLGLFATAATTWFQTLGQKWVTAPQAAVLYTLEPMWAAMFSWIFLRETLGAAGRVGGGLILAAAVLTQMPRATRSRSPNDEIRIPE